MAKARIKEREVHTRVAHLYRSKDNKIIAGVCGGLGEYLNSDPTIIRVIFVVLTLLTGIFPGLLIYLICWVVIPEKTNKVI